MKTTITTTQKKAIKIAKQELATQCNRLRLRSSSLLIRHIPTQCVCGQTGAIAVYSLDFQKEAVVGYCSACGDK